MRRVSNQKILRSVAVKMMKANKIRNLAIIVAIILTATMFTTVFSVGMSLIETTEQSTMRQVGGSSMAGIKYAQMSDYETLKRDPKIKNISYRILAGVLVNETSRDTQSEVYFTQADEAKASFSYPTTGQLPKNADEVATSTIVLEKLGIEPKLGSILPLDIQVGNENYHRELKLCGYWKGDPVMQAQMVYVSKACQEALAPEHHRSYYDGTDHWQVEGYLSIDFDFATRFNIEKQTRDLLERNGYDPDKISYGINWAYTTDHIDWTTVWLVGMVLLMIFIAGYLIIYNIFYIGVVASIHDYGLLKTIGTSEKQIKRMVRIQGTGLSIIGIPIGLLCGTLVSKGIFPLVVKEIAISESAITFSLNPVIYIGAALFVLVTVFVGCSKPGRIAGRISPVEAANYEELDATKRKKKKTKKVSVFYLAVQNLKREKKKAWAVVCSLVLSILLVNGMVSVVEGLDADAYVSGSVIGDYNISDGAYQNNAILMDETTVVNQEELQQLAEIPGVEHVNSVYNGWGSITLDRSQLNYVTSLLQQSQDRFYTDAIQDVVDLGWMNAAYYGVDDGILDYLEPQDELDRASRSIDMKKWKTGDYAIAYSYDLITESEENSLIQPGDKVTVELETGKKTYEILEVAKLPYCLSTKRYDIVGADIMVPSSEYKNMTGTTGAMVSLLITDDTQAEAVDAALERFVQKNAHLTLVSKRSVLEEFRSFIESIEMIGFSLAAVLAMIGIMNFSNTMITSIHKRAREFAVMQAVGLTTKQLRSMLIIEGILYGGITVIVAVLLHLLLGKPMIHLLAGEMWMFRYHFTILPIFVCLPFIIIFAMLVPWICSKVMERQSIVERMRI